MRRKRGRPIHGWIILDKPAGITSTQALARVRGLIGAEKAGHGGTLDPLATGVLPIALGEATKLIGFVLDGAKTYRFRVRWGEARTTDDQDGTVIATSPVRPTEDEIIHALPAFVGEIQQVPPQFSAIKVEGERAYDLARQGEVLDLAPRLIRVDSFELIGLPEPDQADFEVACGKGTYMRSLARDLALRLGTVGHVTALRRVQVGPFGIREAISLDALEASAHTPDGVSALRPIETVLADIPALALTDVEAHRIRHGQPVSLLQRQDRERLQAAVRQAEQNDGALLARAGDRPVALVRIEGAEIRPVRVLNL